MVMRKLLDRLKARRETGRIRLLPDRRLMAESYIPALAVSGGRLLWVGTRAYTAEDYAALESRGAEVWTTDIDPRAARWGRHGRHRTGDVCEIDRVFPDKDFDAVVCNGVLGYGVDTTVMQMQALAAIARVLKPEGLLLLGWNTDKIEDPVAAGLTAEKFQPVDFAGLPSRMMFDDVTHVYDALERRPSE
jgi:SAM-dependent methyltransferase